MAYGYEATRLGRLVRAARKKAGMSRDLLAARIGKGPTFIQNLESGFRLNVDRDDVLAIARVCAAEAAPLLSAYYHDAFIRWVDKETVAIGHERFKKILDVLNEDAGNAIAA